MKPLKERSGGKAKSSSGRPPNRSARLDMVIVALFAIAIFVVFYWLEFAELVFAWTRSHEAFQLDELILTGFVSMLAVAWYALRRWREAERFHHAMALAEGKRTESALRAAAERTLRAGRRPIWNFSDGSTENCERNIRMTNAALTNLGAVILNGLSGQTEKSARDITGLLDGLKQNLETAMRQTHRTGLRQRDNSENAPAQSRPQTRRKRFLLRLVASKVSSQFERPGKALDGLPRDMVAGLEIFMRQTLGDVLYQRLEQESREIIQEFPSEVDAELWGHLISDRRYRNYSLRLMMRLIADFREFERGRSHFVTLVGKHQGAAATGRGVRIEFTDAQFVRVFAAIFGDVFEFVESSENRIWLDYLCGDGSARFVQDVYRQFAQMRDRTEIIQEPEPLLLQDSA